MIVDHKDFKILDDNIVLWKYMSLSKFLNLIKTRSLYLCRIDCFEDVCEGNLTFLDKGIFHYKEIGQEYWEKEKTRHYACCWIHSDCELNLMWHIYGKDGIAIKTTVGHLKKCMEHDQIHKLYLCDVKYRDYEQGSSHDEGDKLNVLRIFFTKRKFFEQEKEVRLLYSEYDKGSNKEKGVSIAVDLSILIDCVLISPTADGFLQSLIDDEIKKIGLNLDVIKSRI